MFNLRNLLVGLVAASVSFGLGNDWMAAFAQNLRSDRHLSDQEIQSLISKFSPDNPEALGRIPFYGGDRRKEYEINRINQFVTAWQKADPSIAPFLGYWIGYEEGLQIYPSNTKGQVCVVLTYSERTGIKRHLNVGTVSGNKLITDGDLGKRVLIKRKRKLQPLKNSASSALEIEYVGMFGRVEGRNRFTTYALPLPLTLEIDRRLEKFGCTTEFPVINLNAGQSVSNKHPAEVVVIDFYTRHYRKEGERNYFAFLAQNRDKFTSELYKNLVRGLRIDNIYAARGLHFQPFADTQSSVFSFQVGTATINGNRAEVPVNVHIGLRYPGQPNPIKLIVVKNGNKWQIADILYPRRKNRSLMDILRVINSDREFQNVPWGK
jgi:hypothetical protein